MEVRPIDGNALYDMIQDNACHDVMSVADVLSFIENAPTLDYEPVRHGEWVQGEWATYPEGYVCNRCSTGYVIPHNYCPNCGALMSGGSANGL